MWLMDIAVSRTATGVRCRPYKRTVPEEEGIAVNAVSLFGPERLLPNIFSDSVNLSADLIFLYPAIVWSFSTDPTTTVTATCCYCETRRSRRTWIGEHPADSYASPLPKWKTFGSRWPFVAWPASCLRPSQHFIRLVFFLISIYSLLGLNFACGRGASVDSAGFRRLIKLNDVETNEVKWGTVGGLFGKDLRRLRFTKEKELGRAVNAHTRAQLTSLKDAHGRDALDHAGPWEIRPARNGAGQAGHWHSLDWCAPPKLPISHRYY